MKPAENARPSSLRIQQTLHKSAYYFYVHTQANFNCSEAKEVEDLPSPKFKSTHGDCLEPEKDHFEAESDDSEFEEEAPALKGKYFHYAKFSGNISSLPQAVHSIVKKFKNCVMFMAPSDGSNGLNAKMYMSNLLN